MPRIDVSCEWAFYTRMLDTLGLLYLRAADLPAKYPDSLFWLYVTTDILTDKKVTTSQANFIQRNLSYSKEEWLKILNWEEDRPFSCPCRTIDYRGYGKSAFSGSILFTNKGPIYRFGKMGFGFFSNKKFLDFASGGAVFSLMEGIYNANSKPAIDKNTKKEITDSKDNQIVRRKFLKDGEDNFDKAIKASGTLRYIDLGNTLNYGNKKVIAEIIYSKITNDSYIKIKDEDMAKYGEAVDNAIKAYEDMLINKASKPKEVAENTQPITSDEQSSMYHGTGAALSLEFDED